MSTPIPIQYAGLETLSLRQLDELNGVPKGTTFRAFKACAASLVEGADYLYLDALQEAALIAELKADGRIYPSTQHLLLLSRSGYQRIRAGGAGQTHPAQAEHSPCAGA